MLAIAATTAIVAMTVSVMKIAVAQMIANVMKKKNVLKISIVTKKQKLVLVVAVRDVMMKTAMKKVQPKASQNKTKSLIIY